MKSVRVPLFALLTSAHYLHRLKAMPTNSTPTEFTLFQRMMLRRFQPQSILLDIVGMIWFIYFFWHHQWIEALAVVLLERVLGLTIVDKPDYCALAKTTWGKIALLHLHPANYLIQLGGVVALLFGIWEHEIQLILGGLSVLFLGHWFGWEKVTNFQPEEK